ncbi:metallophosphoesterase [Neorhizobium sp. NPDC001467]|uniref:metallophosphoesterase n=1 Tax=Neorhizobium sp. NPDC001467 TaxID=3390595 RepID=UPI003D08B45D
MAIVSKSSHQTDITRYFHDFDCRQHIFGARQPLLTGLTAANSRHPSSAQFQKEKTLSKLWILSDLHLESIPYPGAFSPARPDFDVLVAAGDIWQSDIKRGLGFLTRLADGKPVVFVMVNHEYWRGNLGTELQKARDLAGKAGIILLENEAVTLAGCHFVGATLWTDYELAGDLADKENPTGELISVSDEKSSRPFTIADCAATHSVTRKYLTAEILGHDSTVPLVVVTHHAPHLDCLPQHVRGTWAAGNCASDLSELTDSGKAALWINGHIHESSCIHRPGGTRIICNPAGTRFSNSRFDEALVVEV